MSVALSNIGRKEDPVINVGCCFVSSKSRRTTACMIHRDVSKRLWFSTLKACSFFSNLGSTLMYFSDSEEHWVSIHLLYLNALPPHFPQVERIWRSKERERDGPIWSNFSAISMASSTCCESFSVGEIRSIERNWVRSHSTWEQMRAWRMKSDELDSMGDLGTRVIRKWACALGSMALPIAVMVPRKNWFTFAMAKRVVDAGPTNERAWQKSSGGSSSRRDWASWLLVDSEIEPLSSVRLRFDG